MHMTGDPDGPPMLIGAGIADTSTGVHAFAALGYALYRRDRTGEGSHLDIGMVDVMYHMQETAVSGPSLSEGEVVAMRTGRHYAPGGWNIQRAERLDRCIRPRKSDSEPLGGAGFSRTSRGPKISEQSNPP